jgi:hypothetical protein
VAPTAVLLTNVLHFQNERSEVIRPLTIVPRIALLERTSELINGGSFEAALSLTGDWEDLLPAQINLQPDFERIRRPTPWKNI